MPGAAWLGSTGLPRLLPIVLLIVMCLTVSGAAVALADDACCTDDVAADGRDGCGDDATHDDERDHDRDDRDQAPPCAPFCKACPCFAPMTVGGPRLVAHVAIAARPIEHAAPLRAREAPAADGIFHPPRAVA